MSKPTATQMANHVNRIATENGVRIIFQTGAGRAWRSALTIKIGPVKTVVTYAIAMHELGHVLGEHQSDSDLRLIREAYAWKWAFENALPGSVTKVFENKAKKCLMSYYKWANWRSRSARKVRNPRNTPTLPPDGHIFWDILGEVPVA